MLGAKYTTSDALGARAPATSMSSSTSPSAPLGSAPALLTAPSTPTARTKGPVMASPAKYVSSFALREPAPELDDRQGLAAAVGAAREPVDGAELQRGVAGGGRRGGGGAKVGPGLRPIVEAEHGGDHAVEPRGDAEAPGAVPVADLIAGGVLAGHGLERRPEHRTQQRDRARHPHPPGGGVGGQHLHTQPGEGAHDEVDVRGVGSAGDRQLVPREDRTERRVVQLRASAQDQRGLDRGAGRQR